MILTSLVDSVQVSLYPDYSIVREQQRIEDRSRSAAGVLTRYKWGQYRRIEAEDSNVSSYAVAVINAWWSESTPLTVTIEGSITSVYIVNDRIPCGEIAQPYANEYKATLELESF